LISSHIICSRKNSGYEINIFHLAIRQIYLSPPSANPQRLSAVGGLHFARLSAAGGLIFELLIDSIAQNDLFTT